MESVRLSTGLPGLDRIIGGVLAGDNIVWEIDAIDDYRVFVQPYCKAALRTGRPLIYFRFASHPPLLPKSSGAAIHRLYPERGFESFLIDVHRAIENAGRGAFYLFDCLSDLVVDWYSDQMLANFFMLTCPYLFDMETVAYFALFRNHHSAQATSPITDTAQVLLAVYRNRKQIYVRPLKVLHRYSPTMFTLHVRQGDELTPVNDSAIISRILSSVPRTQLHSGGSHLDIWHRAFDDARCSCDLEATGEDEQRANDEHLDRLLRIAISRDQRMFELLRNYLTLADVLQIGERTIGTGH